MYREKDVRLTTLDTPFFVSRQLMQFFTGVNKTFVNLTVSINKIYRIELIVELQTELKVELQTELMVELQTELKVLTPSVRTKKSSKTA